jgi:hypothetical protein
MKNTLKKDHIVKKDQTREDSFFTFIFLMKENLKVR